MSGFDPGEGWRQIAEKDILLGDAVISYASEYGADPTWWVRVPPVPPLPVEPYTVIRVTWDPRQTRVTWDPRQTGYTGHVLVRLPEGSYHDWSFGGDEGDGFGSAEKLRREIVAFDVLAEPRAVTAKAVLDRVLHLDSWSDGIPIRNIEALARELGVSL